MKKKCLRRGYKSEAFKLLPKKLKTKLFDMIEKQVVRNLEMDLWQFFHLYQLEPGRICIIHIQCFPEREEVHILDGFTLPLEGTDFWIINRRFRGEISRPTSN